MKQGKVNKRKRAFGGKREKGTRLSARIYTRRGQFSAGVFRARSNRHEF